MHLRFLQLLGFCCVHLLLGAWTASAAATTPAISAPPAAELNATSKRVYVIPVRDQIGSPILYIIRRGLKEAIDQKADAVILNMKTPGGALDTTFEIMEAIGKFPGTTITYVNNEAMSAGAFISATTQEIWFAPNGIIGAAAPVNSGGQEVEATMRQKIVSYLKARIRATSEGKGYRGEVISAMIDADYQLKVGDKVIKDKGELLSLTASEAAKHYGEPPQTLLSAGTAKDLNDLIAQRFGPNKPVVTTLAVTWSESLAVWLNAISSILLGVGLLAIYIEFKTPGFGVFGIIGIVCLSIVFLGSYVAGLSGHEPILVFGLGVVLVALEVFLFPGTVIFALTGLMLMLGSLVWSMADLWPNEPVTVAWNGDAFVGPLANLGFGVVIAVALALGLARFIPRGWFFSELAVAHPIAGSAQVAGVAPELGAGAGSLVGRIAVASTGLYPSGQVDIDGRRYEARLEVGSAAPGTRVVVRRKTDFGLMVDREDGTT
ncbi:NfeD family protein [Horticoccus sp. 23ND18S-11]|uniref:NfeD family protein n=1 Tax=Horticoccus sp. 23ND18S-11 TaxID=3391832 RepID=UPI0039C8E210